MYALVVMILPLNFTALIGSNWISRIVLIKLVIWISRLLCKCNIRCLILDLKKDVGCELANVFTVNNDHLDLFVDQKMLCYVSEARCDPANLVMRGLHLCHIDHDYRQTRGAWRKTFLIWSVLLCLCQHYSNEKQ